jgi:diguanylate cyclase (GGDEF)-like protein
LLILDLDHFKKINDKHGRPIGDIVLEEVSKAIENTIRECDVAACYSSITILDIQLYKKYLRV